MKEPKFKLGQEVIGTSYGYIHSGTVTGIEFIGSQLDTGIDIEFIYTLDHEIGEPLQRFGESQLYDKSQRDEAVAKWLQYINKKPKQASLL